MLSVCRFWLQPLPVASTIHLHEPSSLRSIADSPMARQHSFESGIALSGRLWIPVAFGLPAFASRHFPFPLENWPFLAVALPDCSGLYRGYPVPHNRDATGLGVRSTPGAGVYS
ncbi:hypothetical protein NKDENANG_02155 [Candidatus Entotheonellaceae bacterium PAL068K]